MNKLVVRCIAVAVWISLLALVWFAYCDMIAQVIFTLVILWNIIQDVAIGLNVNALKGILEVIKKIAL